MFPKHFASSSSIAMFTALGWATVSFNAAAVTIVDPCPSELGERRSFVLDDTVDNGDDTFTYAYQVCNLDSGDVELRRQEFIRDWELPFFWDGEGDGPTSGSNPFGGSPVVENESGISTIFVPEGWAWSIEEIGTSNDSTGWDGVAAWQLEGDPMGEFFDDFFGEDNNPYDLVQHVLHFYTGSCTDVESNNCDQTSFAIPPPDESGIHSQAGFGLIADFGPTFAPYQASWVDRVIRTGDPDFPRDNGPNGANNPTIQAALDAIDAPAIPEPGVLGLLGAGLGVMGFSRWRRKSAK